MHDGVLYRFCRGPQGNRLVVPVCLVFWLTKPTNKPDRPNQSQMLGLAGGLCLSSLEFGPAIIESFCGYAGRVQSLGSFLQRCRIGGDGGIFHCGLTRGDGLLCLKDSLLHRCPFLLLTI